MKRAARQGAPSPIFLGQTLPGEAVLVATPKHRGIESKRNVPDTEGMIAVGGTLWTTDFKGILGAAPRCTHQSRLCPVMDLSGVAGHQSASAVSEALRSESQASFVSSHVCSVALLQTSLVDVERRSLTKFNKIINVVTVPSRTNLERRTIYSQGSSTSSINRGT